MKHTLLHDLHNKRAIMTSFAGYELPLYYTSIVNEHLAVREKAGIFDVSHMGRILVQGNDAESFLDFLLPSKVKSREELSCFYSFILNEQGFIIDDLITMKLAQNKYLLVVNAANKEKDIVHMEKLAQAVNVELRDITDTSVMFAVQGPASTSIMRSVFSDSRLPDRRFHITIENTSLGETIFSRTGYTGEDGYEAIFLEAKDRLDNVMQTWLRFSELCAECGLGARDTLRIEAGLPLYGAEIDERTTPFELEMDKIISWEKKFNGSELLKEKKNEVVLRGLILQTGIPRKDQEVFSDKNEKVGRVTSGTYSPLLKKGIALAKLSNVHSSVGNILNIMLRNTLVKAEVVKPPFYDTNLYGARRSKVGN